jgi:hypothetical protein
MPHGRNSKIFGVAGEPIQDRGEGEEDERYQDITARHIGGEWWEQVN